ncbi:hypothetical protein MYAM1_001883 [Malassezia yamatoensis]|uniref:FAM192A/Fyv6 N-terminal domain-containing protein n=1 Tax=Malassezia yamatoensis TaxID=253288 RepID=A0AAJ5YUW0_9BASI|nr:hypothetical protein MYAM1_001883 [Malassezia yamatoensis]
MSAPSRFVSQDELDEEGARQKQQLKEVYEWIGQEPPERAPYEDKYDPRPLYERLKEQQDRKQEEMDDMFSLANQYRGLDESETLFLADLAREKKRREEERRREDEKALESFRKATEDKAKAALPNAETKSTIPSIPKSVPHSTAAKRKRAAANAIGIVRKSAKDTQDSTPSKVASQDTSKTSKDQSMDDESTLKNPTASTDAKE